MKDQLTSRERVTLALNHQEPDRVPIDITYTWEPYVNLRRALGLPPEEVHPDTWGRIHESRDLVDALGTDFLHCSLNPPSTAKPFRWDMDEYTDVYGIRYRKARHNQSQLAANGGGYLWQHAGAPISEASMDMIGRFPWPDALDAAQYEGVDEHVRHLFTTTGYAITMRLGKNIWDLSSYMRGQESWWMDLVLHPDFCVALMQRVADIQRAIYLKGLDYVGRYISVIRLGGDDFGTQQGPLISPDMFKKLVRPVLESVWKPVKEKYLNINPQGKLMFHSCGSVRAFIPDFIEMGVDVLDPVQPRAKDMNGLSLKREFGDRLSFHGGIDTQHVMSSGSQEEVALETRRKIEMFAAGGGYVLNPSHDVLAEVPPENLIRMAEIGRTYGRYPIKRSFTDEELLQI
ncbi:MAG TPA: uroporphyrinogen decarboxylase family protein [Anaerolineales bacterium]|nr:uroporphyrinogen decarboxylase family protein [Anaerolineales bacterium]